MMVLFDNDGLRVWMDGFSPIVFVKFNTVPMDKLDVRALIKKCRNNLHAINSKFEKVYSVIDLSECGGKCSESLLKFCFTYFPELLDDEVKYLAFVSNPSHRYVMEAQLDKIANAHPHLKCESFPDFFNALGKINSLRQEQIILS